MQAFCKCRQIHLQWLSSVFLVGRAKLSSSSSHRVLSFAFTLLWLILPTPRLVSKIPARDLTDHSPICKQVRRARVRPREKPWADDLELSFGFGDKDLFPSILRIFPWFNLFLFGVVRSRGLQLASQSVWKKTSNLTCFYVSFSQRPKKSANILYRKWPTSLAPRFWDQDHH